jgi:hypothetical protein
MRAYLAIIIAGLLMPVSTYIDNNTDDITEMYPCERGYGDIAGCFDLRTGDMVFRKGEGMISDMFARISSSGRHFSHAGLVISINDIVYVAHMTGSGTTEKPEFRVETLPDFLDPNDAVAFGIYRLKLSEEQRVQIPLFLDSLKESSACFDDDFSLDSDDELYCSELIYKCINNVTGHDHFHSLSEVNGMIYVSFDDLTRDADPIITYMRN